MPGLRLDESPHAIRRRFSESSDLTLMQRLIKVYRESQLSARSAIGCQWWRSNQGQVFLRREIRLRSVPRRRMASALNACAHADCQLH
jgi:hypothetical protein